MRFMINAVLRTHLARSVSQPFPFVKQVISYKSLISERRTHFCAGHHQPISSQIQSVPHSHPNHLLLTKFSTLAPDNQLTAKTFVMEQQAEVQVQAHSGARGKRPFHHQRLQQGKKRNQKKARKRERDMKSGSTEEVLAIDIQSLQASLNGLEQNNEESTTEESLPEPGTEIEVKVMELSSTGDALAIREGSKRIYVLPFAVPGDIVQAKVYRHLHEEQYTVVDFVSIAEPSPSRDDSRIFCKYFARCSGCQFQMLDYGEQLRLKRKIVEKAFRNFSELPPELIPAIQDTIGSPLQYGYRTKLTPHFDGPSGWHKKTSCFTERPNIGFMAKGKRTTMDIEDCPIGTDAVRMGMKSERERMAVEFDKYKRGATILLRESTRRIPKNGSTSALASAEIPSDNVSIETNSYVDEKTCVTDNNGISTEYVGDYVFHNPAGSFFQNNNSILPVFTDYIRQHILPTSPSVPIKYLIDAYSGSGLFTITLSSLFQGSTGIDIADKSIEFARKNAAANNLPDSQANFIAADARELFKNVQYDANETVVVLDPPRKGCDSDFLGQLLRFGPRRVVYVSCNVHTQARDVGMLVRGETGSVQNSQPSEKGIHYEIESIRGFDFFPQTGHVEGVAVLNRVDSSNNENTTAHGEPVK
ncbi:uracil-5--methyltransferase [Xylariaceae sp. FL1651]|nr:uracil-5--methyltransferase [Xylariaceae sp. FL1651]